MNVVGKVVSATHDRTPAFSQVAHMLPSNWFLLAIVPGSHEVTCPKIIKVALSEDRGNLLFGYGDDGEDCARLQSAIDEWNGDDGDA